MLMQSNQPNEVTNQPTMVFLAQETVSYTMETSQQVKTTTITAISQKEVTKKTFIDKSSAEGKFGWAPFRQTAVPYLMRTEEKFVSLKMMHNVYLHYNKYFTNELYNYFNFCPYPMTEVEAKLLNEINYDHSDNLFGKTFLTTKDVLITLKEAVLIYNFLQFAYEKLILRKPDGKKICGFMWINSHNSIPYVWYQDKRYVPLIYIDGDSQYLKDRALELNDWPLPYLKLCCRIHGVEKPLYGDKSMTVVDLELVRKFYHPNTPFEDGWPAQHNAQCLLRPNQVPQGTLTPVPPQNPPPYSSIKRKLVKLAPNYPVPQPAKTVKTDTFKPKVQIPDYGYPNRTQPFAISRVRFGSESLNLCVNLKPFDNATKLATIEELVAVLRTQKDLFMKVIAAKNCDVYLPNNYQKQLLATRMLYHTEGLVEVGKLINPGTACARVPSYPNK